MSSGINRRDFLKAAGFASAFVGLSSLLSIFCATTDSTLYSETYRPQFHFSSAQNYIWDPHCVFYDGEYHLLPLHNPTGNVLGNRHWGHAVSCDLIHWKQLPIAIGPDELGAPKSGSVVVDWDNTAGFKTGSTDVLVAIYTSHGTFVQSIAYSNDRGRTWTKYSGNPVLQNIIGHNRDPKVFWYEPTQKWIMVLYLGDNPGSTDVFRLLSSSNLKQWTTTQETLLLPGSSECPDFFELPVNGNPANRKWVFWGANGFYEIGSFNGTTFTSEAGPFISTENVKSPTFYAAQIWNDIPATDGRRIQIAWMRGGTYPDMPFNQQMSIPCELTLRTFLDGVRLCRRPVRELECLRYNERTWINTVLNPGENLLSGVQGELLDIEAQIDPQNAAQVTLNLRGNDLVYDVAAKTLTCKGKTISVTSIRGEAKVKLRILIDRASIEIFANDGRESIFLCFPLDTENKSLSISTQGGQALVNSLCVWDMRSAWSPLLGDLNGDCIVNFQDFAQMMQNKAKKSRHSNSTCSKRYRYKCERTNERF